MPDEDDPTISVTMTKSAALRFYKALIHGSIVLEDHGKWSDDADWLMWGTGRLVTADPDVVKGSEVSGV